MQSRLRPFLFLLLSEEESSAYDDIPLRIRTGTSNRFAIRIPVIPAETSSTRADDIFLKKGKWNKMFECKPGFRGFGCEIARGSSEWKMFE